MTDTGHELVPPTEVAEQVNVCSAPSALTVTGSHPAWEDPPDSGSLTENETSGDRRRPGQLNTMDTLFAAGDTAMVTN